MHHSGVSLSVFPSIPARSTFSFSLKSNHFAFGCSMQKSSATAAVAAAADLSVCLSFSSGGCAPKLPVSEFLFLSQKSDAGGNPLG